MQHPSSFSPRPGAKIKSIAARSVVDGALENSADGTFDTSDFWYKSLRLAKNEDVTGWSRVETVSLVGFFSIPLHAKRIGQVYF